MCNNSVPRTVNTALVDEDSLRSSNTMLWKDLTAVADGVYQTEWDIELLDNKKYQLLVILETNFDQAIYSDPVTISEQPRSFTKINNQ